MATQPQFVVTPDLTTTPMYKIRGQSDRLYPDQRLSPENCITLQNMNLTEKGTARRRPGFTTYNSAQIAAGKSLLGLIQETFSNGTELEVEVATDAKIYTDDGTTRSDVTGTAEVSTDADDRLRWTLMNDSIYGTDGAKRAWTKGAAGNAAILTSAAPFAAAAGDYCRDLVTHRNFLVALNLKESGTVYPTRIRYCDINPRTLVPDPTVWPVDNLAEVYYSGAAIVGAVDAFSQPDGTGSLLMVFKGDGLYPTQLRYESGFIEAIMGGSVKGFSPLARCSIIATPQFLWCIAKEGGVRINRDLTVQVVTDDILADWKALNQGRLQYAVSWIMEQEHQIHTLLSGATNTTQHDKKLVYDWETGDVWIDDYNTAMNYGNSILISNAELAWLGDGDGYVYKGRTGNDNGTDIDWIVDMAPNDVGLPNRTKMFQTLRTRYRITSGTAVVQLRVGLDEGRVGNETTNLDIGTTLTWNSGQKWNNGLVWPGGTTFEAVYFVNRVAETIAPRWTGTEDVELVGYIPDFEVLE